MQKGDKKLKSRKTSRKLNNLNKTSDDLDASSDKTKTKSAQIPTNYTIKIKIPENFIGEIIGLALVIIVLYVVIINFSTIIGFFGSLGLFTPTENPPIVISPQNSSNTTTNPNTPQTINLNIPNSKLPEPTGIVSYGLYEQGRLIPYQVKTHDVAGIAKIYNISAYNATPPTNVSTYEASLQLNAVLVIQNYNGSQEILWPQNVVEFDTLNSQLNYHGSFTILSGQRMHFTYPSNEYCYNMNDSQNSQYFNCVSNKKSYTTYAPFTFLIDMNASVIPDQGVLLTYNFNDIINIQSTSNGGSQWNYSDANTFESVTFDDPNAEYAYFLTNGSIYTPNYQNGAAYYDTELVFGGGGNGENTHFNYLGAGLLLMFYNKSLNSYENFPSYYTFGGDTAEAADNLYVSSSTGTNSWANAYVSVGTPIYRYLS